MGNHNIPGFPLRFSEQPELPTLQAPLLGEHNAAVLSGLLGYDAAQLEALVAAGVIASADR